MWNGRKQSRAREDEKVRNEIEKTTVKEGETK